MPTLYGRQDARRHSLKHLNQRRAARERLIQVQLRKLAMAAQNGNPIEKCSVPTGSWLRRFRL